MYGAELWFIEFLLTLHPRGISYLNLLYDEVAGRIFLTLHVSCSARLVKG
jgi:hypothetical protein